MKITEIPVWQIAIMVIVIIIVVILLSIFSMTILYILFVIGGFFILHELFHFWRDD
jgi:uncharacterized membrane protein